MVTMTLDPKTYIYPPRAQDAAPFKDTRILGEFGYSGQYKFNDSRCLIKYLPGWEQDPQKIQLWNRHGERFRDYTAPIDLLIELQAIPTFLGMQKGGYHLLDGGLLDKKHTHIKDTLTVWDILVEDGNYLIGTEYGDRYNRLWNATEGEPKRNFLAGNHTLEVGRDLTANVFIPVTLEPREWSDAWLKLQELNLAFPPNSPLIEGLFFKDHAGKLQPGFVERNNSAWQARSRVQTGRHRC